MTPSGKQIRAARALAGWERTDLAKKSGLSSVTIRYIENETSSAKKETMERIITAFRSIGIEFTENQGVRFKPNNILVFEGAERFNDFYDFIYEHLKQHGGDVCLSASDQSLMVKHRKDPNIHYERMKALCTNGTIKSFRVLTSKSEYFHHPMFATFKWQPGASIAPTGFWAFGDCLALISFNQNPSPYVVVLQSEPLAAAYRQAFDVAWAVAKDKPPSTDGEQGITKQ